MRHVIVGGGQAAVSAAAKLRELDAEANILIVGEEPVLPYQRPPLSKKYLSGDMPWERLVLRPQEWFAEHRIETQFGTRVDAVDPAAARIELEDGTSEPYDRLCLPPAPVCVGYRTLWATIWRTSITCAPSVISKRCAHPFAKGNASSSWAADISD